MRKLHKKDVVFDNIFYTVSVPKQKEKKQVLNGLSGSFKSGELTAIMGPSGAGKSTLLNILTGFLRTGVKGSLNLRDQNKDNQLCSYILQEDNLHPYFTVQETMMMACNLKISSSTLTKTEKCELIDKILDTLNLKFTKLTRCGNLSGGQKKRLSIALELIDNPPIMFLDEPTTGLDSSSSAYTIRLLQGLAAEGRTIVCTIHQPSATIFEMFDHVFVLAEGNCVYQGSAINTVPYLSSVGLHCPQYHNAADYLLEVANCEYGNFTNILSKAAINTKWRQPEIIRQNRLESYDLDTNHNSPIDRVSNVNDKSGSFGLEIKRPNEFTKLMILMQRCNIQLFRDWTVTHLKLFLHICCAVIIGLLFGDSGNNGSKSVSNVGSFLVHVIYLWYTTMMPGVLKFPQEMKILKKETFNNWYNLRTYFMATMLTSTPIQIMFAFVYSTIAFYLTSQPMEWDRYYRFVAVYVLTTIAAESFGIFLGTFLNEINGTFIGAVITCFMLVFSGFLMLYSHMSKIMGFVGYFSILRYCLEGAVLAVYDNGRTNMHCPDSEMYCHYVKAETILKDLGMTATNYAFDVGMIFLQLVLFKTISFFSLRKRLKFA